MATDEPQVESPAHAPTLDECSDPTAPCCCEEPITPERRALGRLVRRLVASILIAVGVYACYRSIMGGWAVPPMLLGLFFSFVGIGIMGTIRKSSE